MERPEKVPSVFWLAGVTLAFVLSLYWAATTWTTLSIVTTIALGAYFVHLGIKSINADRRSMERRLIG